jgi:hypothetical protein
VKDDKKFPSDLYSSKKTQITWNPKTDTYSGYVLGSKSPAVEGKTMGEVVEKLEEGLVAVAKMHQELEDQLKAFKNAPTLEDILPLARINGVTTAQALWDFLETARKVWRSRKGC